MEFLFLEHTYRWLKPGGVLALVVPGDRLSTCAEILAVHFRDKAIYRLGDDTWHYILDCEPSRRESVFAKLKRQFQRLPHQSPTAAG